MATTAPAPAEPVSAPPSPPPGEPKKLARPLLNPDPSWSLKPADIVLQLDEEEVAFFSMAPLGDPHAPFGRIPQFTLYRDGTVLFTGTVDDVPGLYGYQLGEAEVAEQLNYVKGLGFAKIPSHRDHCARDAEGESCVGDGSLVVLRARTSGGKLRVIKNYAGLSNKYRTELDAIYERIELLSDATRVSGELRMVLPQRATLFARPLQNSGGDDAGRPKQGPLWPLAPELFDRLYAARHSAVKIDAEQAQALIKIGGTNMSGPFELRHGDRVVMVSLVPWLPGVDHTAAIQRAESEP